MVVTDIQTGIISCNGKNTKLSPGQYQMLKWLYEDELPTGERDGYFLWSISARAWKYAPDYLNYLSEIVFKGMEGEV